MQAYLWAQNLALNAETFTENFYEDLFESVLSISVSGKKKLLIIDHLENLSDKEDTFLLQLHSFIQKHISEEAVTVLLLCSSVSFVRTDFAKTAHERKISISG